ncbi:hypothetical protein SAMN04487768_2753 [Burkholderia sp. b13]|nr:hypothetical protein SAMN04487768_2753 [Burkholderia sp. b13]
MSARPKAELVLSEAGHEQLTALTMRRKTAQALAWRARRAGLRQQHRSILGGHGETAGRQIARTWLDERITRIVGLSVDYKEEGKRPQ